MSARVICISRTLGAGGEAVGQLVSHRLGFRYLDEEIISLAAEKAQVDQRLVANAEHRQTILARLMDAIAERGSLQPSSYFKQSRDSSDYVRSTNLPVANLRSDLKTLIREAIVEVASGGQVVIVAHAASFALAHANEVLRVLVTASEKTRVQRTWLTGKLLNEADSAAAVTESDHARREYLREFYAVRDEQPTDYDLVINTDALEPEPAAACIIAAANG